MFKQFLTKFQIGIATIFVVAMTLVPEAQALNKSCTTHEKFSLAAHGGAVWGSGSHSKKEAFIKSQLELGREKLAAGEKALDVVEGIIAAMEDSGLFNAGKGSVANIEGTVELDASIMDGKHLRAGAVAAVRTLQNPISAARLVMDDTPHVMMVGPPADQYLAKLGAKKVEEEYFVYSGRNLSDIVLPEDQRLPAIDPASPQHLSRFSGVWQGVLGGRLNHVVIIDELTDEGADVVVAFGANEDLGVSEPSTKKLTARFLNEFLIAETERFRIAYRFSDPNTLEAMLTVKDGKRVNGALERNNDLLKKGGTVGAVAMDRCGNLAAGTSTGGFSSKLAGRVGDSPIIGAGTYADNRSAAVSATGHGEFFIRHAVAHEIAARIRHGKETLVQAAYRVVMKELKDSGGAGGVIAIDSNGEVVMLFNTDGMVRGRTTERFQPKVDTYSNE